MPIKSCQASLLFSTCLYIWFQQHLQGSTLHVQMTSLRCNWITLSLCLPSLLPAQGSKLIMRLGRNGLAPLRAHDAKPRSIGGYNSLWGKLLCLPPHYRTSGHLLPLAVPTFSYTAASKTVPQTITCTQQCQLKDHYLKLALHSLFGSP